MRSARNNKSGREVRKEKIIEECVRSARNNKSGREVRKEKKAARK